MKPPLLLLLVLLTLHVGFNTPACAQWRGDGTQRTEAGVPYVPLTTMPEYHTDMPLDCMAAYIVLDSVARTFTHYDADMIGNYPRMTTLDTFRVLARYYYALHDYDPVLVKRYFASSRRSILDGNSGYGTYPVLLHTGMVRTLIGDGRLGPRYTVLLAAAYVVRARVMEVRSGTDSAYGARLTQWSNVACEVLDTIKGMHLPNWCDVGGAEDAPDGQTPPPAPPHCIIYGHPDWWTGRMAYPDGKSRIEVPQPGDELYLFLQVGRGCNGECIMFTPHNTHDTNGGVFPIVDGMVLDKGNFWGLGTLAPEAEFRATLQEHIETIRTWWISP